MRLQSTALAAFAVAAIIAGTVVYQATNFERTRAVIAVIADIDLVEDVSVDRDRDPTAVLVTADCMLAETDDVLDRIGDALDERDIDLDRIDLEVGCAD